MVKLPTMLNGTGSEPTRDQRGGRWVGIASLVAAALATLTLVTLAPSSVDAAAPCKTKKFQTTMVADACKGAGGQKAAKDAMKKWMKTAKKKQADLACATCHSKVGGAYPLKKDGLQRFKDLGGL